VNSALLEVIREKIEEEFSRLTQQVTLLDRQGRCLIPQLTDIFLLPAPLSVNVPVSKSGYLFFLLPGFESQVLVIKDKPGAKDILLLSSGLIQAIRAMHGVTGDLNNALKRLLTGEISNQELDSVLGDHGIRDTVPRCAALIGIQGLQGQSVWEALHEVLPMKDTDLLINIDTRNAVLARDAGGEGGEEMLEYALALQDTLQNELGVQAQIGIGETVQSLRELRTSFLQARQAVEIGSAFRSETQVYEYSRLILERFLSEIPAETARRYTELLFNHDTSRLFSDEMLDTVEVFIKKDLNLTDAARELYIHRNTLVYRLDKIHRLYGLDLRHFRDAMTFKLLLDLKKRAKTIAGSV
jgi:carbohydrate diacid regulator